MAIGIISEIWTQSEGTGGLPRWVRQGWCTYDDQTLSRLKANAVPRARLKLTPLPNSARVVAVDTRGRKITTETIEPTDYPHTIAECVKIGPVSLTDITPKQTAGTYSGSAICRYRLEYQQLRDNDTKGNV